MTMEIKTATAEYTGGGIYVYYGQLQDGNYFRTCDDWETIEICDVDTGVEDADYIEFYEEHRVEILVGDKYKSFWNEMIRWIIQNQPDGNYATCELENKLNKELKEENEVEEKISIHGIMMNHGKDGFSYWDGFSLTKEEEEAIWKILMRHDTEGCSVCGTWEDVIGDIK